MALVLQWERMDIVNSPRLFDTRVERLSVRVYLFPEQSSLRCNWT